MEGASAMRFTSSSFENLRTIGVGKESTIYAAQCNALGGATVAIKVYLKSRTSVAKLRAIKREASLMQFMLRKSVTSITQFYGAFTDKDHICIVMEYCPRGDLLETLLAEDRAFAEHRVAKVATSLLTTLQRMHHLHLIHRDVKLENVFITDSGSLKLGDFGLTMSTKQEAAISPVGTSEYMAPEVVRLPLPEQVTSGAADLESITPCTSAVDIWALGITLYELLSGHLPYDMRDKSHLKEAILKGELRPLPPSISPSACSFIDAMLQPDASQRATAKELLEHPFLRLPHAVCTSPRSVLSPVTRATTCTSPTDSGTPPSPAAVQQGNTPCQLQPSPSLQAQLRQQVLSAEAHVTSAPGSLAHSCSTGSPVRIRGPTMSEDSPTGRGHDTSRVLSDLPVFDEPAAAPSNRQPSNLRQPAQAQQNNGCPASSSPCGASTSLAQAFSSCGSGVGCSQGGLPLMSDPHGLNACLQQQPERLTPGQLPRTASLTPADTYKTTVSPATSLSSADVSAGQSAVSEPPVRLAGRATSAGKLSPVVSFDDLSSQLSSESIFWDAMSPSVMGSQGADLLSPYSPAAACDSPTSPSAVDGPAACAPPRHCLSCGNSTARSSGPPWSTATPLRGSGSFSSSDEMLSWRRGVPAVEQATWSPVRFLQQLSCLLVPTLVPAAK